MKAFLSISLALAMSFALAADARRLARVDAFRAQGDRALADRLCMYWESHATDVFVRNEAVESVGGERAPVPTVMFNGNRSHVTAYARPKIEDLPLRTEHQGGLMLSPKDGGPLQLAPYGKTGCMIGSLNHEILGLARDAAKAFVAKGDASYARLAHEALDTYLLGILHRNVATDLAHGHLQTLFGLQSMETIHDSTLADCCELYALLKPYLLTTAPEKPAVYQAALRKWADVQIANGVADNNWDMMQLNSILTVALVLDEPARSHYVDVVFNQSSVRNLSIRDLAEKGFDPETGIWWECPGYSMVALGDFAKFATRAKEALGVDLFATIPVLRKAFPAAGEYLYPDGMIMGFGDTHPAPVPDAIRAFGPLKTSPFFYAPNASWLVARSGMDPTNDVAFALNGSLGNHQHANGISLELYAKGYRLAPDAGIGWSLYSGDDYKEYYSQFPAHNTVMVNSRSTYQVMKSCHPFTLVDHGANWATVGFREPCTGADQRRTVRYVKDDAGAYFVDVFRSRVPAGGAEWHDYYYHNLGDCLTLNGEVRPTDMIAFVESGLYGLSYIQDKFARAGAGDLLATFDWARPEGNVRMRVFMNGAKGRTFIKARAPSTEGLSRVKRPNYGITRDARTPVLVVRQRGEAWTRPFLAVMDPCGTVGSVAFGDGEIRVVRASGKVDVFAY
ncbi:MAG: heparinase II/III family protein [Kiritimatiellia bacterium]